MSSSRCLCPCHGILLAALKDVIASAFTSDKDIISLVSQVMLIFVAFHLFDALALSTGLWSGLTVFQTLFYLVYIWRINWNRAAEQGRAAAVLAVAVLAVGILIRLFTDRG
ncbi:hypothetical protein CapIbe_016750 [Capra ibex]